jgi:hypothetical protein
MQEPLTDGREARQSVAAEGDQFPVEDPAGGQLGEFGDERSHVPAAAAADAELSLGPDQGAEPVPLDLEGVAAAGRDLAGACEHGRGNSAARAVVAHARSLLSARRKFLARVGSYSLAAGQTRLRPAPVCEGARGHQRREGGRIQGELLPLSCSATHWTQASPAVLRREPSFLLDFRYTDAGLHSFTGTAGRRCHPSSSRWTARRAPPA